MGRLSQDQSESGPVSLGPFSSFSNVLALKESHVKEFWNLITVYIPHMSLYITLIVTFLSHKVLYQSA